MSNYPRTIPALHDAYLAQWLECLVMKLELEFNDCHLPLYISRYVMQYLKEHEPPYDYRLIEEATREHLLSLCLESRLSEPEEPPTTRRHPPEKRPWYKRIFSAGENKNPPNTEGA